jgi:hypothetical protein
VPRPDWLYRQEWGLRAFRKINSRLRTLMPWLHHFLRYARCLSLSPALKDSSHSPAVATRGVDASPRRESSGHGYPAKTAALTVLGVRQPRTAPSVLRRVPERLPQGVLRKGSARDQSSLYFAERSNVRGNGYHALESGGQSQMRLPCSGVYKH